MAELVDGQGRVIASSVTLAKTLVERTVGLLGKKSLRQGEGIWIERCASIHTYFMRFPIDAVFVDGQNRVVQRVRNLAPWTLYAGCRDAAACVELAAGTLAQSELSDGDVVFLRDRA